MNDTEYKEFIGFYRNLFPVGYCEHVVKEFDRVIAEGAGSTRQQSENALRHNKEDTHLFLNMVHHTVEPFQNRDIREIFYEGLQACFDDYIDKYSVLKNLQGLKSFGLKLQKTDPGGGYHVWHSEQGPGWTSNRALVYLFYLNTLDGEGGETEFLYQKERFNPTENQMLLWPAAYTHTHRGNAVFGERSKYIVTGWFYYD